MIFTSLNALSGLVLSESYYQELLLLLPYSKSLVGKTLAIIITITKVFLAKYFKRRNSLYFSYHHSILLYGTLVPLLEPKVHLVLVFEPCFDLIFVNTSFLI